MGEKTIDKEELKTYIQITRITIVICWISLFAFWAVKLFGGNFFEIVVQNKNFIRFSKYAEESNLIYITSFITMLISNYLLFCSIKQVLYLKTIDFVWFIFSVISMWSVVHFVPNDFLKMYYGYFIIILFGIIRQKGFKKCYGVVAILLELIFCAISALTRNIIPNLVYNYMFSLILSFDLYIMYFMYYLYSNLIKFKKE